MRFVMRSVLVLGLALAGCASEHGTTNWSASPLETCRGATESEITALFDRWNQSLETGDARKIVANYAERSILLPTLSNKPRLTAAEKEDYFHHFLEGRPFARIDLRSIQIGCNTAVDSGLYTFTLAKSGRTIRGRYTFTYRWDGSKWLITSHHSSVMPETSKP